MADFQDDRARGAADGRACVAEIGASGQAEILQEGRAAVVFGEMLVKALARSVATFDRRGSSEAAELYAEGFLQRANEAVTALRAGREDRGEPR